MTRYLDTNFFLRFILADNPTQLTQVKELFNKTGRHNQKLESSTVVFFEINWVLKSFYQQPKSVIITTLEDILKIETVNFQEKNILNQTLVFYTQLNLDLEDCYHLAYCFEKEIKQIATFDKKLKDSFAKLKKDYSK